MRTLEYDFTDLIKCVISLQEDNKSGYCMMRALDSFFKDIKCLGVKYTNNIDNNFFGIYVKSMHIVPNNVMDFCNHDEYSIREYMLEIDSKLANELTPVELISLIIYEINAIISPSTIEKFRNAISYYIGMNKMSINMDNISNYRDIFSLMYDESVATLCSLFRKSTDNIEVITADDFMSGLGLSDEFSSAQEKIKHLKQSIFVDELTDKLLVMQWYLSIINDIDTDARYISSILRDGFETTGSKLLRLDILNALNELKAIPDPARKYYTSLTESAKRKSLFTQIKDNGLRSIEQDVYEYSMRIKNVEDENDALLLMRQINNRISILEDYINNEDLDDRQFNKWNDVLNKYNMLRDTLTKKTVYKQKMYGLFADYNALQQMYMRGQLQTIY